MKIDLELVTRLEQASKLDLEVFEAPNHIKIHDFSGGKDILVGRVGRYEFKSNPFDSCMKVIAPYLVKMESQQKIEEHKALKVPKILNWSKTGIFICKNRIAVHLDALAAIDIEHGEICMRNGFKIEIPDADLLAEAWQIWRSDEK